MAPPDRNLKEMAYRRIKEMIIECIYAPGTVINEAQICEQLGISRTPVREAINRLESEGLVKILPKKGILVSDISLNDVMQIFQVRMEIEPYTLLLAAPKLPKDELLELRTRIENNDTQVRNGFRLDAALHLFFIEHCGNRFIIDMMRHVFAQNNRVTISTNLSEADLSDHLRQEHLRIIDFILDGRIEQASAAMREHINSCRQLTLDHFYITQQNYYPSDSLTYKIFLDNL